jgi:hypothetical protein
MVTVKANYEIVSKEYGDKVKSFLNILRNSDSKDKAIELDKIKWIYSFSYFRKKTENSQEYYEYLYNLPYDERLKEELKKVRVSLVLSAVHFHITDRVDGVPDSLVEVVKFMTIQKMVNEQEQIQNQEVIDSIPRQENKMEPLSLEDQLKNAIETEDYMEAARIRDKMKEVNFEEN